MLQQARHELASPFFRPEYHRLVDDAIAGDARSVDVAIVERVGAEGSAAARGDGIVAFFPFERDPTARDPHTGVPAGRYLTDYQGVIATEADPYDPVELLRAAQLDRWHFDHLPVDQAPFARWHASVAGSPVIDLSAGYDAYEAATHAARVEQRKTRNLERDIGDVRFDYHTTDDEVFESLVAWKSAQYRASGVRDIFAEPWCRRAADALRSTDTEHFCGVLSAVRAGDTLVAVHLGLRADGVWHWWLPAYDVTFARYSPGTVLLLEMARHAADLGVETIDLGKGDARYKSRLANHEIALAKGVVEAPTLKNRARHAAAAVRRRVSRSR